MTKTAIPSAPAELEEFLRDGDKVQALIKNGQFGELVGQYAKNVADKDHEISAQIKEQVQLGLQTFLKDNRAGIVDTQRASLVADHRGQSAQAKKQGLYNKDATGAKADAIYNGNAADFFRSVSFRADTFRDYKELAAKKHQLQELQNSFGTNVPADGGFLVPESIRSDLLMIALESSIIRPRATVIPMSTQRTMIPFVDSTSNATTVLGGWQFYWVDEGTAPTESQAKFGQVTLDAKKLMGYSSAPNELVADGIGFDAFLRQSFPKGLAFEEDYRFMQGTGVGEPLGFINCPAAVIQTAETGQGASTLVWENIVKMYARMLPSSLGTAVWIADIATFPQLATMALSVGTGGSAVWLNNGAEGPPMTILGRPVIFTEKAVGLGTTGDINFVDLSYYLVGDRQQMQVQSSTDFLFSSDKTAYKIIERVDGRPWLQSAVTPKNSGSTLSAFVQLSSTRT